MGAGLLTMQTHEAPAGTTGNERGTQFVSESMGSQDLAIALAARKLALGSLDEVSHRDGVSGHPGKLIDIFLQEFILDEQRCSRRELVVNHCPCEQQRRRISGREKGDID